MQGLWPVLGWVLLTAELDPDSDPLLAPLPTLPVHAVGGGKPLDLADVLSSVDACYPALLAEQQRLAGAEGALMATRGAFDPTLQTRAYKSPLGYYDYQHINAEIEAQTPWWGTRLVGGWRLTGDRLPGYYGELETLDAGEVRAGLSVPLWRDGPIDSRRASRQQATQEREAAAQDLRATRIQARWAATQAYWRWVAAGQRYAVTASLLELAEVRDGQLASQVAEGSIAAIERLENRRAIFARRSLLVQAQRDLEREGYALSVFWRDARGAPQVPTSAAIPPPSEQALPMVDADPQASIAKAIAQRPDVSALRSRLQKLEVATRLAKNQVAPRIDFDLSVSKDLGSGDDAALTTLKPTVLEGALRLSMPLALRKARGDLRQAEALQAEAKHRADLRLDMIAMEVRDAWSALQAAEQRLVLAKQERALARAVAEAERRRFELGSTSLLIVNLREQAATDAERNVIDAAAGLHMAHALWTTVLGQLAQQTPRPTPPR